MSAAAAHMLAISLALLIVMGSVPGIDATPIHRSVGCHGLVLPSPASVVREFAPIGRWAGHWGIDVAAARSSPVPAIGRGIVVYAGRVVDLLAVTVDHGGGLRSTYSYLVAIEASRGEAVHAGSPVGRSGVHDGVAAYHLSLRMDGGYVDPEILRQCRHHPSWALYLSHDDALYARSRVRAPRRHLRPSALRSSRPRQRRHRATPHPGGPVRDRG